jgi:hypothetical protein
MIFYERPYTLKPRNLELIKRKTLRFSNKKEDLIALKLSLTRKLPAPFGNSKHCNLQGREGLNGKG